VTRARSDPRSAYARFAAGGFIAVLVGVGIASVGGGSSAHGPQAVALRPARMSTAVIATAGIPTMVATWTPAWRHDPPRRLGSHYAHRAAQHPALVRSPTSAVGATTATPVRATIAPHVTARAPTVAASPKRPVHSWSFSQHSSTRSLTSADGTKMTTTTTTSARTVDGKTTRSTHTQTTITPSRDGTHQSPGSPRAPKVN
jgi:hypothetical protein